jgi:hypothetical protein
MANIEFNSKGVPLMISGESFIADTKGAPKKTPKANDLTVETDDGTDRVKGVEFSNWGSGNNFPDLADEYIDQSTVLRTGMKYKYLLTMGQGIFPVRVVGYDDNGNEKLEVVEEKKIIRFVGGRMVRSFMEKSLRDFIKYGINYPQFIPAHDFSKIVGLSAFNAKYSRLSEIKKGVIENLVYSGKFPDSPSSNEVEIYKVLSDYDPEGDLLRKLVKKEKNIAYVNRDNFSGKEIYSMPDWWTAKNAGWLDVIQKVPNFLINAYDNAMYIKWHIKIPYQYWDKKFPEGDYKTKELRQQAIQDYMDAFETALTSTDNAHKAVFTMYETIAGKVEEQWEITPLDTKTNFDKDLATSAAGNSEILFSLMVNPSVMGAGMPGGPYSGNAGSGSDIREAFLVNVALSWLDRQKLLDPIEFMMRTNGMPDDVELRFKNTVLTTLDTGAGTAKTVS